MNPISRREFVLTGGALVSGLAFAQGSQPRLTAGEVVRRIQKQVGVPWNPRGNTVDTLVAGNEETPVRGVATTMFATLDVLQRSIAEGKNMVVTHETPFYMHQGNTEDIDSNPVLVHKREFIQKNDIAIFHFHDHWHRRSQPDGIALGMVRQLGWEKSVTDPANPKRLTFPGTPLAQFAKDIQTRLNGRTLRVVGDPDLAVRRVQTSWGMCSRQPGISIISQPDVDVLVIGETREWELVEFVRDAVTVGQKKGLIVVNHVLSEQGGMILCADWLKEFVTEVPVGFVAATEPMWTPDRPAKI